MHPLAIRFTRTIASPNLLAWSLVLTLFLHSRVQESRAADAARPSPSLASARRIVVLGDSITYGGEYVEFFETWLRLSAPTSQVEVLNFPAKRCPASPRTATPAARFHDRIFTNAWIGCWNVPNPMSSSPVTA